MSKQTVHLQVLALTPIHIGAAQEKHLAKGVDYLTEQGVINFLDEKKIVADHGIHQYTHALATRTLDQLLRAKGVASYTLSQERVTGEVGTDIKTHITDPLSGQPYLPGSSIKGAIRSVLFNHAKHRDHRSERDAFGWIQEDPFRYLQVGDIRFSTSKYYNTKTFNLVEDRANRVLLGGWKHGNRNSTATFNTNGFTFPYQCIDIDDMASCRIVLNESAYTKAIHKTDRRGNPYAKEVPVLGHTLSDINTLLDIIKGYMDTYLNAEIAFFKKYPNQESDRIIAQLGHLLSENQKAPVLRIGQGSGFHSITGNHIHPVDHTIDEIANRGNRGRKNNADSAKSRKLAFKKQGDEMKFLPMGFVQLLHPEIHAEIIAACKTKKEQKEKEAEALRIKYEKEQSTLAEKARIKSEAAKRAAEEALKPKLTMLNEFKKNKARLVDAIVIGQKGNNLLFKPYVQSFEDTNGEIRYPAGMAKGTVILINAMLISKGKKLQFSGSPKIKS